MNSAPKPSPQQLAELARFPEMNPGPVVQLDRAGCIVLANAAARTFFGREKLVGLSWLTECEALDAAAWRRVLATDERVLVEVERGERCVMFTHVRSTTDQSVFAFGADITERRRAEHQARDQAAALAEVARFPDMNPGPVLRLDLAGCVLLANIAAKRVFGAELVGRSWLEIVPGMSAELWRDIVAATDIVSLEARVGTADFVFAHRHDHQGALVFAFGADVSAQKRAERALRQSEKLATLGTLAAGVAHELNNPAAAARRAAQQLAETWAMREAANQALSGVTMPAAAHDILQRLDATAKERADQPSDLDPMARSDREAEVEEWLDAHEVADAWRCAPPLVAQGITNKTLDDMAVAMPPAGLGPAIAWLAAGYAAAALLYEIGEGSARISEIVEAMKSYSYLGQAPVQYVDLRVGLDSTLVILRSKLRQGITVMREYATDVPDVPAYGSELNQVWTNIIDNAADAMGGQGSIVIRTRRDGQWAVVEIEDNGPGIPAEIQSRVFDPFFTTKEPGKGSGLGLSTSYSIITERHKGQLVLESRPRSTRFVVRLPLEAPASALLG